MIMLHLFRWSPLHLILHHLLSKSVLWTHPSIPPRISIGLQYPLQKVVSLKWWCPLTPPWIARILCLGLFFQRGSKDLRVRYRLARYMSRHCLLWIWFWICRYWRECLYWFLAYLSYGVGSILRFMPGLRVPPIPTYLLLRLLQWFTSMPPSRCGNVPKWHWDVCCAATQGFIRIF
jgi:hypothetical protein